MPEIERYNTRNVAQKEIYDSYMGILRISPNELNGSDVDDPTQFLNVLYDEEKKERMKIILSDSDGNVLPIQFTPRAFQQTVLLPNETTNISIETPVDVINMSTIVNGGKGTLFVSNNFHLRSTLHITPEFDDLQNSKHSKLKIYSGGEPSSSKQITARGVLLYPTESPNDAHYFNEKNILNLFSTTDSTPRHKQVDKNLLSFTKNWHDMNMPLSERITISGKVVSQPNDYQEEVPVYYTRDYILGHYDGHQMKTSVDNETSQAWGENGDSSEGLTDYITKLSWTRIDKLIWDSLEEIIQGRVRHTKGRYDELGIDMGADGIREQLGLVGNTYKEYAPILGTEMAKGMIAYHAMPFHRYWFHRTKQALRGFIERKKANLIYEDSFEEIYSSDVTDLDKTVIDTNLVIDDDFDDEAVVRDEIKKLSQYYNDGILTPNPMGTIGFVNSLSKNFVLCNGKELSFKNFPNISLSNDTFFKLNKKGSVQYNPETGFETIELHGVDPEFPNFTVMDALANTSETKFVRLPNLFALYESTPRFIRGLNWVCDNDEASLTVNVFSPNDATNKTNYNKLNRKNDTYLQVNPEEEYRLKKDIQDASKVYFHTFDHLIDKETHNHHMFSKVQGGGTEDYEKTLLHHYHCRNTRGGHISHVYQWLRMGMMNYDKTCSQIAPLHNPEIKTYNTYYDSKNIRWKSEGVDYLKYCMDGVYKGDLHNKFTPIPNTALFLFNASIFNNNGKLSPGKTVVKNSDGTIKTNKDGTYVYSLSSAALDTHRGTWYNLNTNDENENKRVPTKYTEYHTNGIENDRTKYYYMGADGKKHTLEEASITDTQFEEPIFDEVAFEEAIANKNLSAEEKEKLRSFEINKMNQDYAEKLQNHDKEIQRRKFWAMKANEAEGYIPISYTGKAGGYIILSWSRDERRGMKSSSRNTYEDEKYNVASYIMTPCEDYDEDKSYWRCWSSISYLNSHKLGVGDVENYIDNKQNYNEDSDYYDVHCVTQLPDEEKHKAYSFGGNDVLVNETCPTPSHMNLLPLLRI